MTSGRMPAARSPAADDRFGRRAFLASGTRLVAGGMAAGLVGCDSPSAVDPHNPSPAVSIIVDNDFGGDPDGLFMLSHFLLSQSVELPLVVGSQYRDFGAADEVPDKGAASVAKAAELLRHFPPSRHPPLVAGRAGPLEDSGGEWHSPASAAIVREAMREDREVPLFYACGGSLTEIALAWLAEPAIAERLTLVWIGGGEYPGLGQAPAGPAEPEYNYTLDPLAAQIVFNQSNIPLWQIPRNAFRRMMVGMAELEEVGRTGALGHYLHGEVAVAEQRLAPLLPRHVFNPGEIHMLGDTALVTLTALRTAFQPDAASSDYELRQCPILTEDGSYEANPAGRLIRVYTHIDGSLTWRDFTAKLRRAALA